MLSCFENITANISLSIYITLAQSCLSSRFKTAACEYIWDEVLQRNSERVCPSYFMDYKRSHRTFSRNHREYAINLLHAVLSSKCWLEVTLSARRHEVQLPACYFHLSQQQLLSCALLSAFGHYIPFLLVVSIGPDSRIESQGLK